MSTKRNQTAQDFAGYSDRRDFLKQAACLIVGAQAASLAPWLTQSVCAQEGETVGETTAGKVRGRISEGIHVFKGVPYGADTSGKNRFMPPVKPVAWTGVRDALAYGPSAPQLSRGSTAAGSTRAGESRESEDCLVLNVWTPALKDGGKRPVLLWVHGGGFTTLSGSSPGYDGVNMAKASNVVVITINHRLNVFGFTHLGDVAGSDFESSGVVGMLDVVAALQWVRDNIENFGGDPNRVLVFGESGGGRKTATLMAMPPAKGLFHRGVIQSGAILKLTTREDGVRNAEILLEELGIKPAQARDIQNVPMRQVLAAQQAAARRIRMPEPGMAPCSPVIGCAALPAHPWSPGGPAISADVPLMIGYNRTEETAFQRGPLDMDEAGLKERVANRINSVPADEIISIYKKGHPSDTPFDLFMLICTDHPRGAYSRELAKRKAQQNAAPAYLYRFDWETPVGNGHVKSPHAYEIPFVFNNTRRAVDRLGDGPAPQALATKMSAAWAAFAHTGNPDTKDLPHWPAYSAQGRDTMLFNNECRVEKDPNKEERVVMEKILKLS